MSYISYNGKVKQDETICISPDNRAFRYADGFFETMKMVNGKILLKDLHLHRLYSTLELFKFPFSGFPTAISIVKQIEEIAKLNGHDIAARIRLAVFAGNGTLNDHSDRKPNYIIQTYSLQSTAFVLNEKGLTIDVYRDAVKPCDNYSGTKSNNCLPYVIGSVWAASKGLDDAIILNPYGKIADATIANIFIIKDGTIKTPLLSDGPVNGVMRRYLLKCFEEDHIPFEEISLSVEDILQASEVFLTNAIIGIKWVKKIGASMYTASMVAHLHKKFLVKLSA